MVFYLSCIHVYLLFVSVSVSAYLHPLPSYVGPESSANLLSILSFSWLNSLMALGYSRPLVDDDLYGLNTEDQAPMLAKKFQKVGMVVMMVMMMMMRRD